jgi:DNA-binding NarL/FixJ family response regulator
MLATFGLDEYVFGALRAGATGFLLKDTHPTSCSARCGSPPSETRCSPRSSPDG